MTSPLLPTQTPPPKMAFLARIPILHNLKLGQKLTIGFGILVLLALTIIAFSYMGSLSATAKINTTNDLRVPATLISAQAQANLLRMLSDVRGYLALGDPIYRESYTNNQAAFAANLADLNNLTTQLDAADQANLQELERNFTAWSTLPDELFALRDDQLDREPAYFLLATQGSELAGNVLIDINTMIESQGENEATADNLKRLEDMAKFQGSFASMFSALRGYITTRNRIFRLEYEGNFTVNQNNWDRLLQNKRNFNTNQQNLLNKIDQNRIAFLKLPAELFKQLESEEWRKDLYLFRTKAVPLADKMQTALSNLTTHQQTLLKTDLNQGRDDLVIANGRTATSGLIALILGLGLSFVFYQTIAGPVGRLTAVAEQIRKGDLEAQAIAESKDEIGTLAHTFNNMTAKLRDTLFQVRTEKERADSLLDVVIPIGVQLSSEKDFNRLLETMLVEAQEFCHADGGTLYLRTPEDVLEAVIIRNTSLNITMGGKSGHAVTMSKLPMKEKELGQSLDHQIARQTVLQGTTLNIPDRYQDERFKATENTLFGHQDSYRTISYLSVPLKNNQLKVIGAMQLVNAQDPDTQQIIPFDDNIQELMESYSTLAVAALEAYQREQTLRQEITQLRIQIDEAKREQSVKAIVEAEGFAELQAKAQQMRERRHRRPSTSEPGHE